jgi:hypothetical protein
MAAFAITFANGGVVEPVTDGRQSTHIGFLGNCDDDLQPRKYSEPISLQGRERALRGVDGGCEGPRRPHHLHESNGARLDGYYQRDAQADHGSEWIWGVSQAPTLLSMLTLECQKRGLDREAIFYDPDAFIAPVRWLGQATTVVQPRS